ncbi:MAG: hypothetical protein EXR36_12115 [Betaproteobacteria bacterium]|nr:hypothetical protein [Betaproteobacteria bacterium]
MNTVAYHPTGQPSHITYANGVQTTVWLNSRQWPTSQQIAKTGDLFNMSYTYDPAGNAYDPAGNVTAISNPPDTSYNRGLVYDATDRLTGVNGPWGAGSIGYDPRGNITNQSFWAFSLTYAYDPASQRLATVSGSKGYTFGYDVYGNVTGNGTTSFAYNDAAGLRCANCGLANEILFDYDAANQRVRSRKAGTDTFFVYGQGGQLLWEETPKSNLKEYI